jgi:hypothetical protein
MEMKNSMMAIAIAVLAAPAIFGTAPALATDWSTNYDRMTGERAGVMARIRGDYRAGGDGHNYGSGPVLERESESDSIGDLMAIVRGRTSTCEQEECADDIDVDLTGVVGTYNRSRIMTGGGHTGSRVNGHVRLDAHADGSTYELYKY